MSNSNSRRSGSSSSVTDGSSHSVNVSARDRCAAMKIARAGGINERRSHGGSASYIAVLDHLGHGRAHIATQFPGDIAGLAVNPDRLAGIVLCAPIFLDPAPF